MEKVGVNYVMSSWIDYHNNPKIKPASMNDFEVPCRRRIGETTHRSALREFAEHLHDEHLEDGVYVLKSRSASPVTHRTLVEITFPTSSRM